MVNRVTSYEEDDEVYVVLTRRDEIHEAIKAGDYPSPELAALLEQADEELLAQGQLLVSRFPDVFADRAPREYWWWHLDKGPQVREEAGRAA